MAQGQSRFTANKIAGFGAFFTQNMAIVKTAIGSASYFHFDLNAGCGVNERSGCIGSPLAFREAAIKAGMPEAFCFCCEVDAGAAIELQKRTEDDERTFVTIGRNQDFVEMIPEIIAQHGSDPQKAYGSILIDPNDHRRDAIPYEGLRRVASECPKVDVLFNFPQLAIKRVWFAVAKGTLDESCASDCVDIDDLPAVIGKRHLWIRQVPELGNFAMVVGRNTDNVKDDRRTGLARWDSEDGLWFRERCKMKVEDADRRHQERLDKQSGQKRLW
jgi:hypothetical protein